MSFSLSQRGLVLTVLGACSLLQASISHADTYPSRNLTLVVGYPAGGSVDLTARLMAEELSSRLGQSVVVENAGGAGGTIGAQRVQRAAADGYTLLLGSSNEMIIAGMINKAVRYDGQKDFTPIGMIASQPLLLAASKESGIRSAADYAQKLRAAKPEAFSFGSSGVGTTLHLAGEMVNASTGTTAMHVPYRGVPPLVSDLMSGQLDTAYLVLSSGLSQARAGAIVPLGITETHASPAAPEIPPLADTPGFEKVDINVWFGLYAPKGLPESVANTLRQALDSSLQSATLQEKMQSNGATLYAPGMNATEFQAKEVEKYARLVELAKLQAE